MNEAEFELRAEWPSPPLPGDRDVAHVSLIAEGDVLTQLSDFHRKEDRDFVRGSAVSLAFWFADNWWRLRYEPLPDSSSPSVDWRLRHELTSASGGTLWPPLMIHSTGERILIAPATRNAVDIGSLRYSWRGMKTVSTKAYELGLDSFFEGVNETCQDACDGRALARLLRELMDERSDPGTHAWRQLEAELGYDPDTVPASLMTEMSDLEEQVGKLTLQEAAIAVQGTESPSALRNVLSAANNSQVVVNLEIADHIDHSSIHESAPPWEAAQKAAQQVRQKAGLDDGRISAQMFRDIFQTTAESLKAQGTARNLRYSGHVRSQHNQQRVALQSANQRDRRFELACVLGDRIWDDAPFGIVSKAKTDRQKFQRAFAQNLLVPYGELRKHIDESGPTDRQIEDAAKLFYVHPHVIRRLLVLEGIAPEPTIEEQLEAA